MYKGVYGNEFQTRDRSNTRRYQPAQRSVTDIQDALLSLASPTQGQRSSHPDHVEDEHSRACFLERLSPLVPSAKAMAAGACTTTTTTFMTTLTAPTVRCTQPFRCGMCRFSVSVTLGFSRGYCDVRGHGDFRHVALGHDIRHITLSPFDLHSLGDHRLDPAAASTYFGSANRAASAAGLVTTGSEPAITRFFSSATAGI
jgi:hypothetical protein